MGMRKRNAQRLAEARKQQLQAMAPAPEALASQDPEYLEQLAAMKRKAFADAEEIKAGWAANWAAQEFMAGQPQRAQLLTSAAPACYASMGVA